MHLKRLPFIVQNICSGSKIAHHSNLSSSLDLTIVDGFRNVSMLSKKYEISNKTSK